MGGVLGDVTAGEVLGNIDAMMWGVETVEPGGQISLEMLLEVHRRLLAGTNIEEHGGRNRKVQNWIGGSSYNPCSAAFVPPPPEYVTGLMEDLCEFCNEDSLPAMAQAAIAHAQFETIHPFVDGNGRAGRALIHLVLRRRGYGLLALPPVSLVLAARSKDYVNGLTGTRYDGAADSDTARAGLNRWIAFFASACGQAVEHATLFNEDVRALQSSWRQRVGPVRRDAAVHALIEALPAAPVLTVAAAAELIGRSFQATSQGIQRLVAAGVLSQVNVGRRNRAFESPELIEAFNSLERRVANPQSD